MDRGDDGAAHEISSPPHGARRRLAWLPDALTLARLAAVPLLWSVALLGRPAVLALGAAVAAFTDVLDGILARRLGVASRRGGALDSLADHLLSTSLVVWLFIFRRPFFAAEGLGLLVWAGFGLGVLAVGWMRFRQVGNLHLYSAKAAGVAGYVFGLLLLYSGDYSRTVWMGVLALAWIAAVESLAVILTRRDVADHGGSILLPRRR